MFKSRAVKIILFLVIPVTAAGLSFVYNYAGIFFSPGPITFAHKEIKDSCFKCHTVFVHMTDACSNCHEKVKKSIAEKTGFHGNMEEKEKDNCIKCHTDHKGERYFIIKDSRSDKELNEHISKIWKLNNLHENIKTPVKDKYYFKDDHNVKTKDGFSWLKEKKNISDSFDHNLTGYPLLGEHARVDCEKCHKSISEFKEEPKTGLMPSFFLKTASRDLMCFSCHEKDDSGSKGHKGKYGKDCSKCHIVSGDNRGWKTLVPKVRDFHEEPKNKLKGKHAKAACRKCHETAPFTKKADEKTCFACHEKNDQGKGGHKGKYGKKCEDCHIDGGGAGEWKDLAPKIRDFHKDPKHELKGKHKKAQCSTCHVEIPFEKKTEDKTCYACHKKDDDKIHEETLGHDCELCHSVENFTKSHFDHQKTKYPLIASHKKVRCTLCHPEWNPSKGSKKIFKKLKSTTCVSCHARDDVHHGTFKTNCEKCHRETYWGDIIK
ncbi:MAG: hypothetical protein OEV78_00250 [Spirochaetia bacterium]|nr:hypothetical protein [Spirochaetia bacterium]